MASSQKDIDERKIKEQSELAADKVENEKMANMGFWFLFVILLVIVAIMAAVLVNALTELYAGQANYKTIGITGTIAALCGTGAVLTWKYGLDRELLF